MKLNEDYDKNINPFLLNENDFIQFAKKSVNSLTENVIESMPIPPINFEIKIPDGDNTKVSFIDDTDKSFEKIAKNFSKRYKATQIKDFYLFLNELGNKIDEMLMKYCIEKKIGPDLFESFISNLLTQIFSDMFLKLSKFRTKDQMGIITNVQCNLIRHIFDSYYAEKK